MHSQLAILSKLMLLSRRSSSHLSHRSETLAETSVTRFLQAEEWTPLLCSSSSGTRSAKSALLKLGTMACPTLLLLLKKTKT